MTRLLVRGSFLVVFIGLPCLHCFGQSSSSSSASDSSKTQSASAPATTPQTQDAAPVTAANAKKKKVWTNDDVGSLSGGVSVTGNSKNLGQPGGDGKPDPQYIGNVKKQLEKLQSQLEETDKELVAFKDFSQGKAPEPAGYQINKGYKRIPVDQQIAGLEEKKKQLEDKIGALFDEARKKGVLPGQLR